MSDNVVSNQNEKSLDIMADIFEPYCRLLQDREFTELFMKDTKGAIIYACRKHKAEVIEIAAKIDGVPVDKYKVNPFTLPIKLMAVIGAYSKINNDLFTSQVQSKDKTSSGSATENTEVVVQPINS